MDFEIAAKERKEHKISIIGSVRHWPTALKLLIFCALCVLLRLFSVARARTFFNAEPPFPYGRCSITGDICLWL